MDKIKCKRCGWEWVKRVEHLPARCPHCTSPYWNQDRSEDKRKPK